MVGSNPVLNYIYDEAQGAGLGNIKINFYYLLFIMSGFLLIKKLDSCKCVMFLNYFRDTYDTTGDTYGTTGSTGQPRLDNFCII